MCAAKLINRTLPNCVAAKLFATLAFLSTASPTTAAPVTLRFEATVESVLIATPFDIGLDVNVGDKFTGVFTFEPKFSETGLPLDSVEPYVTEVLIDGKTLATPASIHEMTFRSWNDTGISDFPPASVIDTIEVFSALGADPLVLPNVSPDRSALHVRLYGNSTVLSAPALPADPSVWNSFEFRRSVELIMRGESRGVIAYSANLDRFSAIPEPTCWAILLSLMLALSGRFRFYQLPSQRSAKNAKQSKTAF